MTIEIDDRPWPIVLLTSRGSSDDATFAEFLERLGELHRQPAPFSIVWDARAAGRSDPAHVAAQGRWLRENRDVVRARLAGIAFVFSSPIHRFVMSGVFLVQRLPTPYTVWASLDEARAWAEARVREVRARRRPPP
jgi:hypothetical protein